MVSRKKPVSRKTQGRAGAVVLLALVVLSALPFLQTLHFQLVWDDPLLLGEVGRVAGPGGVPALFASDFRLASDRPLGYYRPLTTTSLWLQIRDVWRTHGADVPPATARALHALNLVLHMLCTVLVWLIIRRWVHDPWVAGLGAALFAVHPVHVEPVAFVSARTDLLAAVFVLGSLVCWMDAGSSVGRRRVVAIAAGLVLALAGPLAKEQALLLPVVLLAWSFLLPEGKQAGTRRTRLVLSALWVLPVAIALALRARVMSSQPEPGFGFEAASFFHTGLPALLLYVKLWILPWPLNGYYTVDALAVRLPVVMGFAAIILLIVVAVRGGRSRETMASLCVFLVFLLPVLRLLPLGGAVAAERFLYLPSAGLALITSLALVAFERSRSSRITSRGVIGAAIVVCMLLSVRGARPWASDASLYAHMVRVSPRAAPAHRGLAQVYTVAKRYPEAARECRQAIQLDPGFADAYELLGVVSARQADYATAHQAFDAALRLAPNRATIHSNLGVLAANEGKLDEAVRCFRRAAELAPGFADAHYKLGFALLVSGDVEGARKEAAILDRLDPSQANALRQRIAQQAASGQPEGAPRP